MANAETNRLINDFKKKTEHLVATSDADTATTKLLNEILAEISDLVEGITNNI